VEAGRRRSLSETGDIYIQKERRKEIKG